MIFVTVGTHEQQFNRLIKAIDEYAKNHKEYNFIIQSGYSTYKCSSSNVEQHKFLSPTEMNNFMENADFVITHGGPSSFLAALNHNKIAVVIPRQKSFNEHINNHQMTFVKEVSKDFNGIIPIYNIKKLPEVLDNTISKKDVIKVSNENNNEKFNEKFVAILKELLKI